MVLATGFGAWLAAQAITDADNIGAAIYLSAAADKHGFLETLQHSGSRRNRALASSMLFGTDVEANFPQSVPTLFLHGDANLQVDLSTMRAFVEGKAQAGAAMLLVEIDGMSQAPAREDEWIAVANAISEFLATEIRPSASP
jgi:hypothetical protein